MSIFDNSYDNNRFISAICEFAASWTSIAKSLDRLADAADRIADTEEERTEISRKATGDLTAAVRESMEKALNS